MKNSSLIHSVNAAGRFERVDFDIHGLIGMRLINASAGDLAAVCRQVGDFRKALLRPPDVTLRFMNCLSTSPVQHLGPGKGFTNGEFLSITAETGRPGSSIPLDQLGSPCEIVCASGQKSLPLLMPILNLSALAKGCAVIHGSALVHNGVGIILAGWAGSGKTNALLGFVSIGAEFIGDEWILLRADGEQMYGFGGQIGLSASHFETLGATNLGFQGARRIFLDGLSLSSQMLKQMFKRKGKHSRARSVTARALSALQESFIPRRTPRELFPGHVRSLAAKPSKLFLLLRHDSPQITLERAAPPELALRVAHLVQHEQSTLMEHYHAFRFAFPDRANTLIECMAERRQQLLTSALAGMETYIVRHPYPFSFADLYRSILPWCMPKRERRSTDPDQAAFPQAQARWN